MEKVDESSDLKYEFEEDIPLAGCDMCPSQGHRGDVFYMGTSSFTGPITNPHLCQCCFRKRASQFFEQFEQHAGCKVVFVETVLDAPDMDFYDITACIKKVLAYDLPNPYTEEGQYIPGWYMTLLDRMRELAKDDNAHSALVEAKHLNYSAS